MTFFSFFSTFLPSRACLRLGQRGPPFKQAAGEPAEPRDNGAQPQRQGTSAESSTRGRSPHLVAFPVGQMTSTGPLAAIRAESLIVLHREKCPSKSFLPFRSTRKRTTLETGLYYYYYYFKRKKKQISSFEVRPKRPSACISKNSHSFIMAELIILGLYHL